MPRKTVISRLRAQNARLSHSNLYRQARAEYRDARPYLKRAAKTGKRVGRASFKVGRAVFNVVGSTGYHLMYDGQRRQRPKVVYVYSQPRERLSEVDYRYMPTRRRRRRQRRSVRRVRSPFYGPGGF